MNTEQEIIADKELRRDLDAQLQKLKSLPPSRERSLARTKIEEAVMWLGMDLKRINEANRPAEDAVEAEAKIIYDAMRADDPEGKDRPWVDGGNSLKQDEARSEARKRMQVAANPYPNSKDPSNTKIEPTADGLKL